MLDPSWSLLALGSAFLWMVLANVIALLPSRDHHWRAAYVLVGVGIPILGLVTWTNGPLWGLACLTAGASVLRWPLVRLAQWVRRQSRH